MLVLCAELWLSAEDPSSFRAALALERNPFSQGERDPPPTHPSVAKAGWNCSSFLAKTPLPLSLYQTFRTTARAHLGSLTAAATGRRSSHLPANTCLSA